MYENENANIFLKSKDKLSFFKNKKHDMAIIRGYENTNYSINSWFAFWGQQNKNLSNFFFFFENTNQNMFFSMASKWF